MLSGDGTHRSAVQAAAGDHEQRRRGPDRRQRAVDAAAARRSAAATTRPRAASRRSIRPRPANGLTRAGADRASPANHTASAASAFRQGTMPVIVDDQRRRLARRRRDRACCDGSRRRTRRRSSAVAHSRAQTKTALDEHLRARRRHRARSPPATTPSVHSTGRTCAISRRRPARACRRRRGTSARGPPAAPRVSAAPATTAPASRPTRTACARSCSTVSTDGTGVSASIVTGIQMLTRFATFDVQQR